MHHRKFNKASHTCREENSNNKTFIYNLQKPTQQRLLVFLFYVFHSTPTDKKHFFFSCSIWFELFIIWQIFRYTLLQPYANFYIKKIDGFGNNHHLCVYHHMHFPNIRSYINIYLNTQTVRKHIYIHILATVGRVGSGPYHGKPCVKVFLFEFSSLHVCVKLY